MELDHCRQHTQNNDAAFAPNPRFDRRVRASHAKALFERLELGPCSSSLLELPVLGHSNAPFQCFVQTPCSSAQLGCPNRSPSSDVLINRPARTPCSSTQLGPLLKRLARTPAPKPCTSTDVKYADDTAPETDDAQQYSANYS